MGVRIAERAFSNLCLALVIGVPLYFLIILSQNHFRLNPGLTGWLGLYRPPFIFCAVVLFAVPVGLGMGIKRVWKNSTRNLIVELEAGLILGAWLTTLMITVDYLGAYPNIIGGLIGVLIGGFQNFGLGFWMGLYLTNFILWPLAVVGTARFLKWELANQREVMPEGTLSSAQLATLLSSRFQSIKRAARKSGLDRRN